MRKLLEFLVFLALVRAFVRSVDPTLNDDVLGLIVFKVDVDDPGSKLITWNEDDNSPCNWVGVKCDPRTNRVSELNLDGFSLSGRINQGLLQLQFLRKLLLSKNNFTGTIDSSLARLENLQIVDLSENNLSGSIPYELFGRRSSLRVVSFAMNNLSGEIPQSFSSCPTLAAVNFSSNRLYGSLPSGIWSLNGLCSLDLSDNLLEGEIPKGIEGLYNLRAINLSKNQFSGQLPDGIGGCFLLKLLDFSENSLSGSIPDSMQRLTKCNFLSLSGNSFVGEVPTWIGEMRNLQTLDLSGNRFSGQIPDSLGNLQSLEVLNLSGNRLTGSLPASMINCKALSVSDFSRNLLNGSLPLWMFGSGLQVAMQSENRLIGEIHDLFPSSVETSFQKLHLLDLSDNLFSGEIPGDIVVLSNLQYLNMSTNSLVGGIPASIGQLKGINVLDLSGNRLNGSIPSEIGGAVSLKELRLEKNFLAGTIPNQIFECLLLTSLILSHNHLSGPIPANIVNLINLQTVDLSLNNLIGSLPKQLADLPHLVSFNVSYNHLQGELPPGGIFDTISPSSVSGNPSLCGAIVNRSCPGVIPKPIVLNPNSSSDSSVIGSVSPNLSHKKAILSISALIAIGAASIIFLGVIAVTVLNLRVRASTTRNGGAALNLSGDDDFSYSPTTDVNSGKLVMFSGDPDFSAGAHALLNKDCELGRGGFGVVYRTVLRDGSPVAIKKLTISSLVKSQEDFEREVKKLGKIRHQHLVALEGYYWTPSLQLLIYEFVSGGSLYKHLHEGAGGSSLSWHKRFNIILGTARSLAHLHRMNVIHYNLKSNNVLIDSSGEPKLGDFGLAKLLPMLDRYVLSSKIQSALGYMAPEFACPTVKITEKCDVYGFGVLILEVVTGKRPVEYMEDDVVVLCDMVRGALEEGRVEECVDKRLGVNFVAEEAILVMKLGLICTSQVPSNRPEMAEVVNILELITCPSGQEELG